MQLSFPHVVFWQARRRIALALVVGAVELMLRAVRPMAGSALLGGGIIVAYVTTVLAIAGIVRLRPGIARVALLAQSALDLVAIFGAVAAVTPPAFYARALFLSLLALQFTEAFFGRAPSLAWIAGSGVAYLVMLVFANRGGVAVHWADEAWVLALYAAVAINSILLRARATHRLASLVELFGAAQRGDFSRTFEERDGDEPDAVTLLGRAYNQLRSELAAMVMTDALTRSLNRRGFDQVLGRAIANAQRRRAELALLAVDVDHFKSINDTVGHLAGDAVLYDIAGLLARHARAGDVVARVGGEEFLVLLPDADAETAGVVAERIMTAIREHAFTTIRGGQRVSASVGIAVERVIDNGVGGALRARADEALYVAKRLGRNRAVMWAPGIRSNATPPWTPAAVAW